ncbi:DEAD/DEAH box helicase [Sporolactobacillus sp. THM7-7]|nr:DEAD/DEAH box helicase [Sporolactobacillus sp. THM7-7]
MTPYLQLTFVPQMENGWNFFIWLTDEKGEALPFSERGTSDHSLPDWLSDRSPYRFFMTHADFIHDRKTVPVHGAIMTMDSVFHLIRDGVLDGSRGAILPGKTFQWFGRIAEALHILLKGGHFYPFFYHLERGNHERCTFCEWMPDADLLIKNGLFGEWLIRLPRLAFSIADLQEVKVQQWLHLIIIFWTNALVRETSVPIASSELASFSTQNPENSTFMKRILTNPFNHSEHPWIVAGHPQEMKKMDNLERETAGWVRPVQEKHPKSWTRALLNFRTIQQETYFSPENGRVVLNPEDPDDLFSDQAIWSFETVLRGWQSGRKTDLPLEQLRQRQPLDKNSWFDQKLRRLRGKVPKEVLELLGGQEDGFFSGGEVSRLYRYKDHFSSEAIDLVFPDSLRIREADPSLTVNLDIREKKTETGNGHSLFSLDSLIRYDWRIAIGDIRLSAAAFRRLVKENQSFIRHGGEWVHLPIDQMMKVYQEMDEAFDLLERKPSVAGALQLEALRRRKRNRKISVRVEPALDQYLVRLLRQPAKSIPLPAGFRGKLRPYQKKGYTWLVRLRQNHVGGCLADDMGLGKTVQTIAYLSYCQAMPDNPPHPESAQTGPALIVCPTSIVENWNREFRMFSPELDIYVHHGSNRLHDQLFDKRIGRADVMITSYALFTKESARLKQIYWKSVILDEAQAIKNPHAQKTRALRQVRTVHRLVLTGTPIENRLEELWSIMDFLNPGYLGSLEGFRKRFIRPIEKKGDRLKARQLTKIIHPFLLRREKTDKKIIYDLPDKIETSETCYLSKDQASLYQSFVDRLTKNVATADGIRRKGLILSTLTKLKQVCDHPSLVLEKGGGTKKSGKLELFFNLLHPLFEKHRKVIAFTQYVQMGRLLSDEVKKRFPDASVLFLHGGLNARQREQMIQRFQKNDGKKALFILSLKAGGVGINLTAANDVIHYDRWWNPAVEDQATDRAYRIGQNKNVHVYKLICEGTLEERIDRLISRKKELQKQILGQGEAWVTEMSDREILNLIQLREGVV